MSRLWKIYLERFPFVLCLITLLLYLYTRVILQDEILLLDYRMLTLPLSLPLIITTPWLTLFKRFCLAGVINEALRTLLFLVQVEHLTISSHWFLLLSLICFFFCFCLNLMPSKDWFG